MTLEELAHSILPSHITFESYADSNNLDLIGVIRHDSKEQIVTISGIKHISSNTGIIKLYTHALIAAMQELKNK